MKSFSFQKFDFNIGRIQIDKALFFKNNERNNQLSLNNLINKIQKSQIDYSSLSESQQLQLISKKVDELLFKLNKYELDLIKSKQSANNKSDFLSIMSHEIRTPLNAIIGNINVLKQETHYTHQEECINTLSIASENLLNLINDVLDFNKFENGAYHVHKSNIEIKNLIENVKSTYKIKAIEKSNEICIEFDENIPNILIGDEYALIQILNNLISNALKFTANGYVKLKLKLLEKNKEICRVNFIVEDNGIGISKDNLGNIFKKFGQANDSIKKDFGGSGLGLTIIKRLVEINNSEIFVHSELGDGTTFEFTFTFEYQDTIAPTQIIPKAIKDLNKAKILIADDIEFNLIFAKKIIEKWNAEVHFAKNGQEVIDYLGNNEVDFILMDIHMPILNGLDATKKIRELNYTIPIVALTATYDLQMSAEILDVGMNDFISKPFNPEKLYQMIEKHLNF